MQENQVDLKVEQTFVKSGFCVFTDRPTRMSKEEIEYFHKLTGIQKQTVAKAMSRLNDGKLQSREVLKDFKEDLKGNCANECGMS